MSCYFPNGKVAPGHTPCNTNAPTTHCCDSEDACLTNSYCLSASGNSLNTLTRGSCTDNTWHDAACPLQCSDISTETIVILNMASANFGVGTGTWCCNDFFQSNNTCQDATHGEKAPWALPNGRLIYDRTNGSIVPVTAATQSSCKNVTVPTSSSSTNTTLPTTSNSTAVCPTQTVLARITNTSREAAIGASIGAPLALIIFLLTVLYLRAVRSRKQLRKRLATLENQVSLAYAAEKNRPLQTQPWELDPNGSQSILLGGTPVAELDAKRSTWRR